jgi:hypothetical protein
VQLNEALARLRTTPEFQAVLEKASEMRPIFSPADPNRPMDAQFTEFVYRSGQLRGFEILFNLLKGSK